MRGVGVGLAMPLLLLKDWKGLASLAFSPGFFGISGEGLRIIFTCFLGIF